MEEKPKYFERLKSKWELKSMKQLVIILIVFSLTGFTFLFLKDPIFNILGIPADLNVFLKIIIFLVLTLPVYNVLLLVYGFLFGQFKFFWSYEKKFFARILRLLKK